MATVLIVAYLLIVLALIAVILLQRSEGGALGIGGGTSGFMTARGSANLLTRTTGILAALFFAMAIGLTLLSQLDRGSQSILDRAAQGADGKPAAAPTSVLDALNQLQQQGEAADGGTPAAGTPAPDATTPAAPANPDAPDLAIPAAPADAAATPAAPATTVTTPAPATTPATPEPAPITPAVPGETTAPAAPAMAPAPTTPPAPEAPAPVLPTPQAPAAQPAPGTTTTN
ncbi:MAG TPA: preprotein translocase subunit SecG [Devosiaceae bacterium]|jgi:preprotein translocase subunit SecG